MPVMQNPNTPRQPNETDAQFQARTVADGHTATQTPLVRNPNETDAQYQARVTADNTARGV